MPGKRHVARFILTGFLGLTALTVSAQSSKQRNVIIFVADGLRTSAVNATDSPTLLSIRNSGTYFANSHSLFPTFTTANASAIATGHELGDTGDFSNTIYGGYPIFNTGNFGKTPGTVTPFIENDQILADLDDHYNGNYLNEETLMAYARTHGYNTASVGKLGPVAIQDVAQINPIAGQFPAPVTIFLDDATGGGSGIPLTSALETALTSAGLPLIAPTRSNGCGLTERCNNGYSGTNMTPGTNQPNLVQQKYFADAMTKAILPTFTQSTKPFYVLFWSRDPDGTQHNQGDSLNRLTPGINGPTSKASIKNADNNLAQIIAYVRSNPALANNTDIVVTADHGFSTISKHELTANGGQVVTDYASKFIYKTSAGRQEVNTGYLPVGFLAIDIAHEFGLPLYDPDTVLAANGVAAYAPVDPTISQASVTILQHPVTGDGIIGGDGKLKNATDGKIVVAANGGSDLIYVPSQDAQVVRRLAAFLATQTYVGGLFVADKYSDDVPGALPLSSIGLVGSSVTPQPAIAVNFRNFATDPARPNYTRVEIADSGLQEGQGMHGSLSRADTFNNIAAIGPDFKANYVDGAPMSNADLAPTIAKILGFDLPFNGMLRGRILWEALAGNTNSPVVSREKVVSAPSANRSTVLLYQILGGERYYDEACLVPSDAANNVANPCR